MWNILNTFTSKVASKKHCIIKIFPNKSLGGHDIYPNNKIIVENI